MADSGLPDFLKGFEEDLDVDFGFDIVSADELREKELLAPVGQTEQVLESNVQGIGNIEAKVDEIQGTLSSLKALLDFDELNIEGKLDKLIVAVNNVAEEAASAASSAAAAANISPTVDLPEGAIVVEESAITAEKLDKIMAAIGDPEKRKAEVEQRLSVAIDEHKERVDEKLRTIEKLVLPFMYTFIKPANLEKTYIYWPNRKEVVERQIKKVLAVTQSEK